MEHYIRQLKSTRQIAKEVKVSPALVSKHLKKYNIPVRTKSEAQSLYLQKGTHPTKGKEHSEETKRAIGKKTLERWKNLPEEEKAKSVEIGKKSYQLRGAELKASGHKACRKSAYKGSKLEHYLDKYLRDKGITVEVHKNMLTNERLEVDLFLPEKKIVIEVNGPSHYKPISGEEKLLKQQKADLEKRGLVTSAGYIMIVVRNLKKYSIVRYAEIADKVYNVITNMDFKTFSAKYTEIED